MVQNTLTRKIYDRFILPVEKTATTSIDYYRGIMFVCTGYRIYQCNPTTNKVLSYTDLNTVNPVLDIDVDSYGTFYAICNNEQKVKKFDTFTGQAINIINIDNFQSGQIIPFRYFSSVTSTPDSLFFIDGFFNDTLKTNRLIRYDLSTQISTVVNELPAANNNDLEYDDIGLLRLTDTQGVIERYNINFQSIDFGKKIDEIPVGDPVDLVEESINPTPAPIETFENTPPDISYFVEQPFAFLTLEPNSNYLPCLDPQEWQLVLNPEISCQELSINFIKLFDFIQPSLGFVNTIEVSQTAINVTLSPLYNYSFIGINVTDDINGKVYGTVLSTGNLATFNLANNLGDNLINDPVFDLNKLYHIEIITKLDTEDQVEYHTFNTDFILSAYPLTINTPIDNTKPFVVSKAINNTSIKVFFNEDINPATVNSINFQVFEIDPATLVSVPFPGTFDTINNEVTFNCDFEFNPNFQYNILLNDIEDLNSNKIDLTGFYFKFKPNITNLSIFTNSINQDFVIILDSMESQQQKQTDACETLQYLENEKKSLLRDKYLIETIIQYQEQRTQLLLNHDTTQFPYNYQLEHLDRVLDEYTTIVGANTLDNIQLQISEIDNQIITFKKYILDLEEILRYAELECRESEIYVQEFAEELEEQIATANQTLVTINTFNYVLGGNYLAVYKNGVRQERDIDYVEQSTNEVLFLNPLNQDDIITLIKFKDSAPLENVLVPNGTGNVMVIDSVPNYIDAPNNYEYQFTEINQVIFTLKTFTYTMGSDTLFVYVNKVLQNIGTDYIETFNDEIQFLNSPAPGSLIEFKQGIRLGNNVQTELNLNSFKVYDSFNRLIPLEDLQPFYIEVENEDIARIVIDSGVYYLFGTDIGKTTLTIHLGGNQFSIDIEVFDSYTPPLPIVPYHCPQFLPPLDDIYQLALVDLTTPCVEEIRYKEPQLESHLVVWPITACETGIIQVNPGEFAIMFEGTINFPDYWATELHLEDAQPNQNLSIFEDSCQILLEPENLIEMPIVLEDSLEDDIYLPLNKYLKLSPIVFDQDLVIQESLQFDPAYEIDNPMVLEQGVQNPSPAGPLEIEFLCFDTPADDEDNTLLIQGNTGLRHPVKITWDGDFCYVLYDGECAASLIDLKSILRKVFISTPDPELYGIGLHTTSIFAQTRDVEGQEFALSKITSSSISFINTFQEYLNSKDSENLNRKIFVTTNGTYYGPDTIEKDPGIIFNYNYQSGIRLNPGEEIIINFDQFTQLEGSTFLAKTPLPLQYIVTQTSEDGIVYTSQDTAVINKANLGLYELNQFLYGIQNNKITTYIKFLAPETNTSYVDICLINLFSNEQKFERDDEIFNISNPISGSLLVVNQEKNPDLQLVFSPDPVNFLTQTFTAPINPLINNPTVNALESGSLSVTGVPSSKIIPAVFGDNLSSAINPVAPITDVRGNNELIYRSGLLYSFKNYILNSDWRWGLLNWNIVGKPLVEFKPVNDKQLVLSRNISDQTIQSGILSQPITCLPFTTYFLSFSGLCNKQDDVCFIKLEYYDINNNFLTYSTPIYIEDTNRIVSIQKNSPEFATSLRVFIGFLPRTLDNPTTINDTIKLDWVSLTTEAQSEFTAYNDNLDVLKIAVEI